MLRHAGFAFDIVPVVLDESIESGEAPSEYVSRLADLKVTAAAGRLTGPRRPILGADTVVVADGQILGKPRDSEHAKEMLRQLSGREHHVLTGLSIRFGQEQRGVVDSTRVRFVTLEPADIEWYVGTGEPLDKAGAYGIQGLGGRFVAAIEGSYTNVVGLPIERVHRLLMDLGLGDLANLASTDG